MNNQNIVEYELISTKISSYFPQVAELYYRLIIVSCNACFGQSYRTPKINFQQIAHFSNSRYININLELSRVLLELTQRQRALKVEGLLEDIIGTTVNEVIFLEHLEILFDRSLEIDPLRCLQKLARNRIIVALWSGIIENNQLIYAEPGHAEYRRYPTADFLVVNLE
ncbi:MAG: BREX-3 system P-loop-containing protein BrxF [Gloeotrichia echinulata IR180]